MWQKIKCWLGWHEWKPCNDNVPCSYYAHYKNCGNCNFCKQVCKHCGKVKR